MDRCAALIAWSLVGVVGCAPASFEVAGASDASPADSADDSSAPDGAVDSGLRDEDSSAADTEVPMRDAGPSDGGGSTPDAAPPDGMTPEVGTICPADTDPVELFVNGSTLGPTPTGSRFCPYRHIADAVKRASELGDAKPRTIHVADGTYVEGVGITLGRNISLIGAGEKLTTISGGGPCYATSSAYDCVVRVNAGAVLKSVTIKVTSPGRYGVITGTQGTDAAPTLKYVAITGATGGGNAGILVMSGATLGPSVDSSGNTYGAVVWGSLPVIISDSRFDNNMVAGINVEGLGAVTLTTVRANSNGTDGVRLGDATTSSPPLHRVTSLTATGNTSAGVRVTPFASAKIRSSTLSGNAFGVVAIHGMANTIDLGTSANYGGNSFGTASSSKNTKAGVCALATTMTPLSAIGNSFPNCTTPKELTTLNCESIAEYSDVWYRGSTAPMNLVCTASP